MTATGCERVWWERIVHCGSTHNPDLEVRGRSLREHLREAPDDRPKSLLKNEDHGGWWGLIVEGTVCKKEWNDQENGVFKLVKAQLRCIGLEKGRSRGALGASCYPPQVLQDLHKESYICLDVCMFFVVVVVGLFWKALDWLLQLGIWCLLLLAFFSPSAAIKLLFWSLARLPHVAPLPTRFVNGGLFILYSQWTCWDWLSDACKALWADWLRDVPPGLIASQKPWLLPAHFPLLSLLVRSSSLSQCLFSQSPLLTNHLTPGGSAGGISDMQPDSFRQTFTQDRERMLIPLWGGHSPTFEFLCKNGINFLTPQACFLCLVSK